MGIVSLIIFPLWVVCAIVEVVRHPSERGLLFAFAAAGGMWSGSTALILPCLFFRLRFRDDQLEFRWFGYATRVVAYREIVRFEYPACSYGGFRLQLRDGQRHDVYMVDFEKAAELLRNHGVEHAPAPAHWKRDN